MGGTRDLLLPTHTRLSRSGTFRINCRSLQQEVDLQTRDTTQNNSQVQQENASCAKWANDSFSCTVSASYARRALAQKGQSETIHIPYPQTLSNRSGERREKNPHLESTHSQLVVQQVVILGWSVVLRPSQDASFISLHNIPLTSVGRPKTIT